MKKEFGDHNQRSAGESGISDQGAEIADLKLPWSVLPERLHQDKYHVAGRNPVVVGSDGNIVAGIVRVARDGRCDQAETRAELIVRAVNSHADMLAALAEALRYVEVSLAYKGGMTAAEVEQRIKANANVTGTTICANSVTPLATFDFVRARALLARAEGR